jgi:hypothetical protein
MSEDQGTVVERDPYDFSHVMTVAKLREALKELPDDMPVVLSSDAEGNSHSPLSGASQAMYSPDSSWDGEIYNTPEEHAELIADPNSGFDDDDAPPDDAVRVLLLGPVN